MSETPFADSEASFARSAGRTLAIYGIAAVFLLVVLMVGLQALAGLVGSSNEAARAFNEENNSISITLRSEPPQLDSTIATDAISGKILGHVMEGLLRMNLKDQLEAAIAHKWEVTETHATFWLRDDARWSDGKPITADDFVFAWRTVIDPKNASEYAAFLFPIKNAKAINQDGMAVEQLGVSAPDPHTLVVELERPIAIFDKMVTFVTYLPVRQDFYEATNGRYGADADQLVYSGPFMITSWVHGSTLSMKRNPYYWDQERIHLDGINVAYITPDATAKLNFFKDEKVAFAELLAENLENAQAEGWHIQRAADGSAFFLEFNHRPGHVGTNWHFRRALQLTLDMDELIFKVTKLPGYIPGRSLFPGWLNGINDKFRKEYPAPPQHIDFDEARKHLEIAKQELGIDEFPPLALLSGDTPVAKIQAEWLQETLKRRLGIDLKIDTQIFKQRLAKMTAGEFDMVLSGWGPDYDDPLTFGDLFASWNPNNRGRYANAELDEYITTAQNSIDQQLRMDSFGKIQQHIFDQAAILPMYEREVTYVVHPRVKNVKRRVIGPDTDFTYAYIAAEE